MEKTQSFVNALAGNPASKFKDVEFLDNSKNPDRVGVKVTLKPVLAENTEELIGGISKGKVVTWWTSPSEDETADDRMVQHLSAVQDGNFTFVRELSVEQPHEKATPAESGLYSQVRLVKYNGELYKAIRAKNAEVIAANNKPAVAEELPGATEL
jgi:hypothetical protein